MNESDLPVVDFHPFRWGDPEHPATLPASAREALAALGVTPPEHGPVEVEEVALPPSTLPAAARSAIEAVVGAQQLHTGDADRLAHTRGWSTTDLLKLRGGDAGDAPDAVVTPGDHDEIVAVLEQCAAHNVAVVPFSGGTSVVGGLSPARRGFAAVLAVDLGRLRELTEVDEVSRTAVLQAGMRGPDAERQLNEQGFTLGHFPQSFEGASIGGYAAARSAGQASAGYGRFDEMVVAIELATPLGTVSLGTAPKSAAGPDLRQLVLGSEGTLGIITSVTVRIRPMPQVRSYEGWQFDTFDAGAAVLRRLAQDGPTPTVMRLSDEVETQVNLSDPSKMLGGGPGGCMAIIGFEGTEAQVRQRREAVAAVIESGGGRGMGSEPGEAWRKGRYRAPYLRDPLLDGGVLIETLESAGFWSKLPQLRTSVTEAISQSLQAQGTPALVLCHISHVYETGASLYFTVACAQASDPIRQWAVAKAAANEAIAAGGGAASHHHGIGTDHRGIYAAEIGPLAMAALRAAKAALDPTGILNPGILIADAS